MQRHGEAYVRKGIRRYWATFRICAKLVRPGDEILSAGAGGAFIEKALSHWYGARVTAVEFPQAVQAHASDYRRYGIRGMGANLAAPWDLDLDGPFDMALSFQVIEHLPVPPQEHIAPLAAHLRPGGHLVLSTPNFARASNLVRLAIGKPLLADPRLAFQPASYEREHVHRREYVAEELVDAFAHCGLEHLATHYHLSLGPFRTSPRTIALRLVCAVVPRLRNTLILVGRKR